MCQDLLIGVGGGVIVALLIWFYQVIMFRFRWKWIKGEYYMYSFQKKTESDPYTKRENGEDQTIIIESNFINRFIAKSEGNNGKWEEYLDLDPKKPFGIGIFKYTNNEDFGMHEYQFDRAKKEIRMVSINKSSGSNDTRFILEKEKTRLKTIKPE